MSIENPDRSCEERQAMGTKPLMKQVRVHLGTTRQKDIARNIAFESGGGTKDVGLGALEIISR